LPRLGPRVPIPSPARKFPERSIASHATMVRVLLSWRGGHHRDTTAFGHFLPRILRNHWFTREARRGRSALPPGRLRDGRFRCLPVSLRRAPESPRLGRPPPPHSGTRRSRACGASPQSNPGSRQTRGLPRNIARKRSCCVRRGIARGLFPAPSGIQFRQRRLVLQIAFPPKRKGLRHHDRVPAEDIRVAGILIPVGRRWIVKRISARGLGCGGRWLPSCSNGCNARGPSGSAHLKQAG